MSIMKKLQRMKKHISSSNEQKEGVKSHLKEEFEKEIPFRSEWEKMNTKPFFFEGQYCLVRTVTYPLMYKHGLYTLGEFKKVVALWHEKGLSHPLSAIGHEANQLFFFDTETTGLKGGAGTMIFLLGHARVEEEHVIVKQHFLPGPGHEVALYKSFLSEVDIETLVTYNGKAFDWPQVKSRHTFIKNQVPRLPAFGHFDLYHAARRLWKDRLEAVKLSIVEKEILDVKREEDTPGYLAPMLYFYYLKNHDPSIVKGIFKHNEIDVLSLITLYTHISNMLLNTESFQDESYYVAKWFQASGNSSHAMKTYERIKTNDREHEWKAKYNLSMLYKKERKLDEAVKLWKEMKSSPFIRECLYSYIELAKYYEHTIKDYQKALKEVKCALLLCQSENMENVRNKEIILADLQKRKTRICKKIQKCSSCNS